MSKKLLNILSNFSSTARPLRFQLYGRKRLDNSPLKIQSPTNFPAFARTRDTYKEICDAARLPAEFVGAMGTNLEEKWLDLLEN